MSWFNVLSITGWLKNGTTETPVSEAEPLPVTGPLTDAQLRATPVNVAGTIDANDIITQNQPALVTREIDMETQVAHGLLEGFSIVNKFGYNSDIDTTTVPEDVWGGSGPYTGFPATAVETLTVVSTSANDTLAGTGAQKIRVIGLDTNYNVLQEDINLNGTVGGVSTGQFRRVHTAFIIQAGSNNVNAGDITVRHTTTSANVFLAMLAGRNQTNCSAYTIPDGYTGYMRRLMLSARVISSLGAGGMMMGGIWTKQNGFPFRLRRPFLLTANSEYTDEIYGGLVFTSRSDLIIRVTSVSDNNGQITAAYDMLLVKNT